MKRLTKKQKDFIAVGKRMKEIIALSDQLTLQGHPVIDQWMKDVQEVVMKHEAVHMLKNIWQYNSLPIQSFLFETLTDLRRILKNEGVFSQDMVE